MSNDGQVRSGATTPLAARRVAAGWTQEELADAAGISLRTYARLEGGEPPPGIARLANLALLLNCDPCDLIEASWKEWHYDLKPEPHDPKRPGRKIQPRRTP